jgi:hypothetical protein
MKVYIVNEYSEGFNDEDRERINIVGVYASYYDAEDEAEDLAEYAGLAREGDCWFLDDMKMITVEEHEVL